MRKLWFCTLAFAICHSGLQAQSRFSAEEAREDFVGHKVYVANEALRCFDKMATIESIRVLPPSGPRFNALGEPIIEKTDNPVVNVSWVCADARKGVLSEPVAAISSDFIRLNDGSTIADLTTQLQEELDGVLLHEGVYPRTPSPLFSIDSTLLDLQTLNPAKRFEYPTQGERMAVVATKVWKAPIGFYGLLKLQTLSGKYMFAAARIDPRESLDAQFAYQVTKLSLWKATD